MTLRDFQMYTHTGSIRTTEERSIKVSECDHFAEIIYVGATMSVERSKPPGHYIGDSNITLQVIFEHVN